MKMPRKRKSLVDLYIVKYYDMLEGWKVMTKPISWKDASEVWWAKTHHGTVNTRWSDAQYYDIFPFTANEALSA